jgi:Tfp pilus assembly protein PilO
LHEQERTSNFEFYSKCQKSELDKLLNQLNMNIPSKAEICKDLLNHVNKVCISIKENLGFNLVAYF